MNRRHSDMKKKTRTEKDRHEYCSVFGAQTLIYHSTNIVLNKKPRTRTVNPSTRSAHKKHGFQLQTCKSVFAYMPNILSWFSSIMSEI